MNKKTFAFKLAAQKDAKKGATEKPWQARHGVAVAGCSEVGRFGNLRYDKPGGSLDDGVYC